MKKKVAMVTGATGFVGSHLVKCLSNDGWEVHAIVRKSSNISMLEGLIEEGCLHFHDGSMSSMLNIFKPIKVDVVFHLASLFISQHKAEEIEQMIASNILFSTQLVEAMTSTNVRCMVNTGTSWQHYNNDDYNPVNLYAATKQAFDSIMKYYTEISTLKIINLKLFDTYGPKDSRQKLFQLLRKAANSKQMLEMSPGEQLLDLVFIDDVTNAYLVAAERLAQNQMDQSTEEYAVTSGNLIRLRDLLDLYCDITGYNINVKWGGREYRSREVMIPWRKGAQLRGWKANIDIVSGIKMMEGLINNPDSRKDE